MSWINGAGGDFLTGTNWSSGLAPTAVDDIQILIATSSDITLGGSASVNNFLFNNSGATMSQTAGSDLTVNGLFTLSAGTYNLSGTLAALNLNNGMTMNGGSFNQSGALSNLNLSGTITLNAGTFTLSDGSINGGTITGGGNRFKAVGGTLNGVSIGLNTADFTNTQTTITGNTTFAAGSSYTLGVGSSLFVNQASISNVAFTMGDFSTLYSQMPNFTWTIGDSGSASPAISYSGPWVASLATQGVNPDNNLVNDHIIENTGTGSILIFVSGSFTNNPTAILRASNGRIDISNFSDAFNNGTMITTGGTINVTPSGNFTNSLAVTADTGTINITPSGSAINAPNGTLKAINGTININPTGFSNQGTIEIQSGGTVNILSNIDVTDLGTVSRSTPNTGTLGLQGATMTLNANTDIAPYGTFTLSANPTITSGPGGPFTLSSSNGAKIQFIPFTNGGTIDNVNLGVGVLSFANGNELVTFSGNTTFAANSSYSLANGPTLIVNQPSISNVALTFVNGGTLWGGQTNSTWTIGPSGTSAPAILSTGPTGFGTLIGSAVANNSLINNALIVSNGAGGIGINPTGNFTNNGTLQATTGAIGIFPSGNFVNNGTLIATGGTIFVGPGGTFTTGAGSQIIATGNGAVVLPNSTVTNSSIVDVTLGQFNVSTNSTAAYSNTAAGSTSVLINSSINVGNSSTSTITNDGSLTVGTAATQGGTINVGDTSNTANLGKITNNNGSFTLNGTANARVDIVGGTLSGSGTINALPGTSVVIGAGGKLSPGNSPGQITIGGGLDVRGQLEMDISNGGGSNNSNASGGNQTPGSGFDTILVRPPTGSSTTTSATIHTSTSAVLKSANANQSSFNSDTFWASTQRWTFLTTTNGTIQFLNDSDNVVGSPISIGVTVLDANGNTLNLSQYPNSSWLLEIVSVSLSSEKLNLVWTPVPEPTLVLALSSAGFAVGGWLVRRKRSGRSGRSTPSPIAA
ncbi:MAG: PEP-CTERM sorting domain-containing protein [Gemmataceae bacterium]